jgi:hypothetical protein
MTPSSPTCIRCNANTECQDHWYQCSSARTYLQTLRNSTMEFFQKSGLHHSLQDLVDMAIFSTPTVTAQYLSELCNQQKQIGWDQFVRGRISNLWVHQQNNPTQNNNGAQLMTKVLTYIIFTLHNLWTKRNDNIHGNDPLIQESQFTTFIAPRVKLLYSQKHLLPVGDQNILDLPITVLLKQTNQSLEKWLQTNEAYLMQSITRETKRLSENTHTITSFFPITEQQSTQQPPKVTTKAPKNTKSKQSGIQHFFHRVPTKTRQNNVFDSTSEQVPSKQDTRLKHDLRPP